MKLFEDLVGNLFRPIEKLGRYIAQSEKQFCWIVALVLFFGFSAHKIYRGNIGGHTWGIDFYNLYTYHHCEEFKDFPYKGVGDQCLDSREMIYPPVMYWLYSWVRGLSYNVSYGILVSLIVSGLLLAGLCLPGESNRKKYLWFFPLLLIQFPSAFAIERGNNDIFVVFLWLGIMALWYRRYYFGAGILAGIAVQAKIYPIIPVGLLGLVWLGLLFKRARPPEEEELLKKLNRFVFGLILASIALFLLLWEQNLYYWFKVLPKWASQTQPRDIAVHGVRSIWPSQKIIGLFAGGALAMSWLWTTFKNIEKDQTFVLAGLLSIATYYQGVANDYNLITAYPLFALMLLRATGDSHQKYLYAGLLPFGFFSALGYKWFWGTHLIDIVGGHIALQVFWLILVAFVPLMNQNQKIAH